jgi:hypothetical protein
MIDFFASATIALIVIMTLVLFLTNMRQAAILKQMRLVMEDWYDAQMRDRRKNFKEKIHMPDAKEWLGSQVNLTVVDQARRLMNPPAAEFLTSEGPRLVVSPFPMRKLRSELRNAEGKRRKVAKLVQPLLGYRPSRAEVIERSNKTVHEWYEVEVETVLEKLGINWGEVKSLYFYIIPLEPEKSKAPIISFDMSSTKNWFEKQMQQVSGWFNKRQVSQFASRQENKAKTPVKKTSKTTTSKKAAAADAKKSGSEA